ncbi:unnamed protein product [Nesidiocoris tenuis]|uniref:Uncharacterized protein n=1 Tax=Nesidiocoris tenuis TaxID=355587 RepID=A0A6H5G428_9HEMI|nr:unnamed protein product [Nesidiocoris tenuis]
MNPMLPNALSFQGPPTVKDTAEAEPVALQLNQAIITSIWSNIRLLGHRLIPKFTVWKYYEVKFHPRAGQPPRRISDGYPRPFWRSSMGNQQPVRRRELTNTALTNGAIELIVVKHHEGNSEASKRVGSKK